jgi:hypothetical protein
MQERQILPPELSATHLHPREPGPWSKIQLVNWVRFKNVQKIPEPKKPKEVFACMAHKNVTKKFGAESAGSA